MDTRVQHKFNQTLADNGCFPLTRARLSELQVNLGYLCNQACEHCHVEAGPKRTELMSRETMARIVEWAKDNRIRAADLTGGAPELNPHFRWFVDALRENGIAVTSRCNITVLLEPGQEDLARWYAERNVRLVCSLPCYSPQNVDRQRGKGVFGKSIEGLQRLNALGYGNDPDLVLDLVYNPVGPALPPSQQDLEQVYRDRLKQDFDIGFSNLLTITNLPINRFAHYLERTGQLEDYLQRLADNFNPATVAPLMCRHLLSVDWRGYVYDCDFNQMLGLSMGATGRRQLWEVTPSELQGAPITVGSHCYGCTAGAGSSCGGALA
jgi:radical SAM/Cys-rich protein